MVMRNRGDAGGASPWWDDLPPRVRARFTQSLIAAREDEPAPAAPAPEPSRRAELVADLTRFAALFAVVTVAILLYLLVVVSYVTG